MRPAPSASSFARALAAAFAHLGVSDACISPGSRNTPLTVAFAENADIRDWSHHDERSAGFFALGLAKASGRPVVLISTSGTAAAEYAPAVVEASLARVPLLVLTADRPTELRDVGAPQTIDQIKLYGDAVRWFHQGAPPDAGSVRRAPALAAHAFTMAASAPAGPVHLNLPFIEPLAPDRRGDRVTEDVVLPQVAIGRTAPAEEAIRRLGGVVAGKRVVIVAGALPPDATDPVARVAARLEAPVLADPQSGLRSGATGAPVIASGDALAATGSLDRNRPEVVLRFGGIPTSKPVWSWLERHRDVPQILVDDAGWRDATASAGFHLRAHPALAADAMAAWEPATPGWLDGWLTADEAVQTAIDEALSDESFPNEPAIARTVAAAAPGGATLYAGSSMPIRDVDAFMAPRRERITVLANRGGNGIDGLISSGLGAAATGRPVVVLSGDVAALHDLGALATAARLALPITVVVVHNDGGGIFQFLPQADPNRLDPVVFERHLTTPHGVDFVAVAAALGLEACSVDVCAELESLVAHGGGPRLVELRTDRHENVAVHRRIRERVAESLR